MTSRISDDDLKIRHTTVDLLIAALEYVPDDSSKKTVMGIQKRINKAVEQGRMAIDSRGHYRITQEWKDIMTERNRNQSRGPEIVTVRVGFGLHGVDNA
jgi:hypothetical protein